MDPFSAVMLSVVVPYLISAGAGLHVEGALERRRRRLADAHAQQQAAARTASVVQDQAGLEAQLAAVIDDVMRDVAALPLPDDLRAPLAALFGDPDVHADLVRWLRHWYLPLADDARGRLTGRMAAAGLPGSFAQRLFEAAEVQVFADPVLANWRLHLALRAAGEEREELLRRIRERDGVFAPAALAEAEKLYRALALAQHDIVDLLGLPEDDRALATRQFVLRQLYIPLRVAVEQRPGDELGDGLDAGALEPWERRSARQQLVLGFARDRSPVGALLHRHRRVVVLGDPGGGKTTLMRWFSTAFLLRLNADPGLAALPDVASLPPGDWLPILVRCRELPADAHACNIDTLLDRHLELMVGLGPTRRPAVRARLLQALEDGAGLLIIDGLDEIADPRARARFCQRLELIARTYAETPILVTSRVVGYREMPGRLGRGFAHTTLSELDHDEMDAFARRWAEATEPAERQARSADDLITNIHSSERVERLAGNPMLLTTLALVHRKIGRLPQRRHDLYREALQVLLNWRGELDERLSWDEAVPQLQYLAYAMCRDGVQQLPRARVLDLLDEMRASYRRLRAVRTRSPEDFLDLLEHRSSLLIEAGRVQQEGREVRVYEFRHLTFQEYLAALALVRGRFPGHDPRVRLPERIAPLAGLLERSTSLFGKTEMVVTESWREPLRLCLTECDDDDVDDALLAVAEPMPDEEDEQTARPRAIMAALCLADEPAISEDCAAWVLKAFAAQCDDHDGHGSVRTAWDAAASALAGSTWQEVLCRAVYVAALAEGGRTDRLLGGLAYVSTRAALAGSSPDEAWLGGLIERLGDDDPYTAVCAAMAVMQAAYEARPHGSDASRLPLVDDLADALLPLLDRGEVPCLASIWALFWLVQHSWVPRGAAVDALIECWPRIGGPGEARHFCAFVLAHAEDPRVVPALIEAGESGIGGPGVWHTLGRIGAAEALAWLTSQLRSPTTEIRINAVRMLAMGPDVSVVSQRLLSRDLDGEGPWLDPRVPIDGIQVARASKALDLPPEEIRALYTELAPTFDLRLAWT